MPDSRWCRYYVSAIATSPRPPHPSLGITPDMVIPIAPNSIPGRGSVHPNPSFPFSNCVHWYRSPLLQIRIIVSGSRFELEGAICLSADQQMALEEGFDDDFERMVDFVEKHPNLIRNTMPREHPVSSVWLPTDSHEMDELDIVPMEFLYATCWQLASGRGLMTSEAPTVVTAAPSPIQSSRHDAAAFGHNAAQTTWTPTERSSLDTSSDISEVDDTTSSQTSLSEPVRNPLVAMDVFGWNPDPETPLLPLAELWLDISNHIDQENIPHPVELYKEMRDIRS